MALIITLSTIPPRFDALGPTLKSLLDQTRRADEIRLYIPYRYRRFPGWNGQLPRVPEGVRICRTDHDLGPATKVLPAVADLRGQGAEILFCDDDRLYDARWSERFMTARTAHPDCAIVEAGKQLHDLPNGPPPRARRCHKGLSYRLMRAATLGRIKPPAWAQSGHVDVLAGFGGVLVRPAFFSDDVFDIPDVLWTVDDFWLSGNLAQNGVRIWLNANAPLPQERRIAGRDALLDFTEQDHGRRQANDACVTWYRNNRGVWLP